LERSEALKRLLKETGFGDAERVLLAGDASTRRYERLIGPRLRAVLMDAAPNAETLPCPPGATPEERRHLGWNAMARLAASRVEAFAAVTAHLSAQGLSTPQIYGADIEAGYMVLEDLGDDLYARVIAEGAAEEGKLYEIASEVLAHVHAQPLPSRMSGPGGATWPLLDYDALALEVNADLFAQWLPQAADRMLSDEERAEWRRVRDGLIVKALGFARTFTIRDYHAENLIWLPERRGLRRVGLLDYQDAVRGWRGWDFAMLLDDARRDVSEAAREAAIGAYLDISGADEQEFRRELAVLGALNAMRIIGRFAQLASEGKSKYAAFMPREWGHLERNLRHPALEDARAFVQRVAGSHLERAA
jgi:hypothetical protein